MKRFENRKAGVTHDTPDYTSIAGLHFVDGLMP